jgi:hypothetical protein
LYGTGRRKVGPGKLAAYLRGEAFF